MKIKELFEEAQTLIGKFNADQPVAFISSGINRLSTYANSLTLREIITLLENEFENSDRTIQFVKPQYATDTILIFAQIEKAEHTTAEGIQSFYDELAEKLNKVIGIPKDNISTPAIWICGMPPFKIEWSIVNLKAAVNQTTYKGIEKLVSECNSIIFNLGKSKCGILSFLKLPKDISFNGVTTTQGGSTAEAEKAANILNKYIKGDRNVLNCQEELIDNGLEEYAQL